MSIKKCRNCGKEFKVTLSTMHKEQHCSIECRNDAQYRFWAKVSKGPNCWTWQAYCDKGGYGRFWLNGKWIGAHRVAYQLEYGSIPDGLHVMHLCDNPVCVRPDHLQLGTHEANMHDMYSKRRRHERRGESHHNAKLTEAQVNEIRQRYAAGGISLKTLGYEYGVHASLVHRIVHDRAWKNQDTELAATQKLLEAA